MVPTCSAYNCTQRYQKEDNAVISFHNFPKDPVLRKRWIHEMKRKNWQPTAASKLCSKHFSDSCYTQSGWSSQRRLKPDAIPTEFDFTEHLKKKKVTHRPSPKKRELTDNVTEKTTLESQVEANADESIFAEDQVNVIKKRRCYLGDYLKDESLKNSLCPEIKNFLEITRKNTEKKNKQLRLLRQELRRTKEKLKTLGSIVTELKNKNLASDEVSEMLMAIIAV